MTAGSATARLGVVAIGRNEGERLVRCMASLAGLDAVIVYVDSASADGSPDVARAVGAHVVALDLSIPFTAARARNAGVDRLVAECPDVALIQFIDGDCTLVPGWIDAAIAFLDAHPRAAVVCGRRREQYPDATLFNRMCDMEWDTPVGEALACGGDALVRAAAFRAIGGYDPALIAHEEPEMCARLRAAGWTIHRIDAEMTLHDAAMTRWGQYWKRSRRGGFGFAQAWHKQGFARASDAAGPVRRALFWSLALPLGCLALALLLHEPLVLLLFPLGWAVQFLRLLLREAGPWRLRLARAFGLVSGKLPEALGVLEYALKRASGRRMDAILYK